MHRAAVRAAESEQDKMGWITAAIPSTYDNSAQEAAGEYVRRNQPGDREKALGLLQPLFEFVNEIAR